jgi:hypothetical protein
MSVSRPVRLAVELQASDRSVIGELTDEHGERRPFDNWLQLLTLLEAARLRSLPADGHHTSHSIPHAALSAAPPHPPGR